MQIVADFGQKETKVEMSVFAPDKGQHWAPRAGILPAIEGGHSRISW